MNKRILELMKQAGTDTSGKWMSTDNSEKLVEVLLAEIDKVMDNLYHALPLEQAAVLLTLDEEIKEHFYGVEE